MAIRRAGNVIIIDSVGLIPAQPETKRNMIKVAAVGLFSIDSTALINIALAANTTNIIFPLSANASTPKFEVFQLGNVFFDELNVITVTAGTAYLYLA